jgi:hypothetical protein
MVDHHSAKRSRINRLPIVLLVVLGFWWFYSKQQRPVLNPDAKPRAVTARGDLAADEKNTIEIFQSVAPSVVHITSVELLQPQCI